MSLKELTYEHHRNAERQKFVKTLMGGNIPPKVYAEFLYNQYVAYNILEVCAMAEGVLNDLPDVRRAPKILEDIFLLIPLNPPAIGDPNACCSSSILLLCF